MRSRSTRRTLSATRWARPPRCMSASIIRKRCLSVTAAGCGYGSQPRSENGRRVAGALAANRQDVRRRRHGGRRARQYADGPTRQSQKNKDPRGYAHFVKMLSEHSALGHSLTMLNLQAKRATLWDMEAELKKFAPPLLVIVGDEDEWCVDASIYLRARCRRPACLSCRVPATPSPARSRRNSTRRWRNFLPRPSRPVAVAQAAII